MNFYTVFMLFSGVSISAFLRQTKNRSAENDFSFGAENSGAFLRRMGCGGIFVSPTVFFSCGLRLCFLS